MRATRTSSPRTRLPTSASSASATWLMAICPRCRARPKQVARPGVEAIAVPNATGVPPTSARTGRVAARSERKRWSWDHAADEVWRQLDPDLWDLTHNPWGVLQTVSRDQIERVLADPVVRAMVNDLVRAKRRTAEAPAWFQHAHSPSPQISVAYFSMEYMLSEALP